MWQVANGKGNDIVSPREDNISISTEETLDYATSYKVKILQYLNELQFFDLDLYSIHICNGNDFSTPYLVEHVICKAINIKIRIFIVNGRLF